MRDWFGKSYISQRTVRIIVAVAIALASCVREDEPELIEMDGEGLPFYCGGIQYQSDLCHCNANKTRCGTHSSQVIGWRRDDYQIGKNQCENGKLVPRPYHDTWYDGPQDVSYDGHATNDPTCDNEYDDCWSLGCGVAAYRPTYRRFCQMDFRGVCGPSAGPGKPTLCCSITGQACRWVSAVGQYQCCVQIDAGGNCVQ